MTHDQQSTGRTPRWFRGGLRAAAVGSALCLAAGMGLSMATQASAAPRPLPPGGHSGVLPVCISFGGILRLALPFSTCNGPIVPLEIAGFDDHGPVPPPPPPPPPGIITHVHVDQDVAAAATTTLSANALCTTPGEVATGGGFALSGPAPTTELVITNAPTTNGSVSTGGQIPNDWAASVTVTGATPGETTLTAYAVCAPAPHFFSPKKAQAHAAARR